MKNLNLIKRLWTDSHEKQSPQRFARYAAILFILLTLGIGQMWGATSTTLYYAISKSDVGSCTVKCNVKLQGDANNWATYTMASNGRTDASGRIIYTCTFTDLYDGLATIQFQLYDGDTWKSQVAPFTNSWTSASTYNGKIWTKEGSSWGTYSPSGYAYYVTGDKADGWLSLSWDVTSDTYKMSGTTTQSKTISSVSASAHKLKVSTYNWGSSWGHSDYSKATHHNVYSESNSDGNISFTPAMAGDVTISFNTSTNKISIVCAAPTITFDKEGGSDGTSSQNTYYNETTSSIIAPSKNYHDFGGYWTDDDGTGTQVIGTNGAWIKNVSNFTDNSSTAKWLVRNDYTLHAKWTPKTYTITYKDQGNVTYSGSNGGSLPTSYTYGTGIASLTDGVKSGYRFDGWFTTSACTGDPVTTISTSANGNKIFYAKWTENPGGTVTLTAGTGGQVSKNGSSWGASTSYTGIKSATPLNIYAQANTGYTFNTWTKSSGSGTITTNAASGVFTPVADADAALTASFTENMSTLTTSNHYDAGDPSYSAPSKSVSSIGISTTADLTAAAPGTGYTFAGWTLSSNIVVTSGNAATDRSITIRTNGNGAAATAQANYTEDLSSPYTIKGGTNITGNNWSTAYNMTKKSGHSTESVVYYTFNISSTNSGVSGTADDWSFKVIKDGSTWYGLYASGSYWWGRGTSANQPLTGEQNIQICADVAGPYEIKVDYTTPASPKVTVTFPTKYTVTYSVAPSGAADAITTSPNVSSGGEVASGTSITFTHASANTGYTWYRWENGSGSSLGTGSTYNTSISANTTVVAKYTENNYNVTVTKNLSAGGSVTPTSVTAMGQVNGGNITATPNTGYNFTNWTITSGTGYFGSTGTSTTSTTKNTKFRPTAAATIRANFTAKQYTITLNNNGGEGGTSSVKATYKSSTLSTAITNPTRTGYTFNGWHKTNGTGQLIINTGGALQTGTDYTDAGGIWNNDGAVTLYAGWTPKTTTVSFSQSGTGYGSGGQSTTKTATYDAAMPTPITCPTAANGYAFMGYYDALEPLGTQYYDETGASAHLWDKEDATATLYAYFKKAEITALVASPGVIAPGETITITPTIEPTPTGTTKVCYEVQYSNGTPLPSQPTFTPGVGNAVSFPVPSASATYIIQAVLETGSTCGSGTELSTRTTTFQVAGAHDVTVKYMCGDLTIKASEVLGEIRPLTWSDDITAPTITGYTFARWDAGDGVTIKDGSSEDKTTSTSSTIKIKAVYDGTLTAVYTKKRMIYFNNTLGWSSVYVYFYKNESYWDKDKGTGANTSDKYTDTPYSEGLHGEMTQIEGTNIFYFDAEAAGVNASYINVAFTELDQHGYHYFYETNAVRRGDYKTTMPMFVPLADQEADVHNKTNYYNSGYWMNYPENSGYTLKIYNAWNATKETAAVQSIAFPYSEDLKMPLKMDVELSDGYNHDYWFMVYRNDGTYMGSAYHFKQGYQDEQTITGGENKNKITTSAPGNYTFILTYHDNGSGTNNYYIDVDFPIASGDYRIVYKDNAAWSHGTHGASWCHPSHSIAKATTEAKKDTVSFFISKAVGITPSMKFQKASITNEGVVTWADVAGGSITIPSSVTTTGVYNFIVSQPAGGASISLEKVEPYTGNFYIRTDCAGNTKWDSFKNVDHQMTYSDYAEKHSGYSHYYAHWVTNGTNVKFCIANDYSMCITDTLTQDYGTVIANIDAAGALNSASANIRFMWNQATNKISRAYISGSTNISDRFLVLEGDSKMYDKDGSALSISGLNPNEANLIDDQNFVYEREIQVNTKARAKLTAKYNSNIQYFKGGPGSTAADSVELLGGDASGKHTMRIVYDFKTNRLVTAYVPSGTINDDIAINADLMIVREHQGAGQQLLFEGDGALSKVHTVYGVMRFNRWTLNNKEKTGEHSPVGDPKSIYERSLYWISFPFNVNLSDVFGFGTYGVDWIIEYYDGAERATNGYWVDSDGFWKMVMPAQRADFTLEAGKGYVLAIDIDAMKDNNKTFWANNIEQVELFFPSATNVENITQTTAHTIVPEHECTIDRRTDKLVNDINKDRTKADSHWNMIGIPSYANYGATLTSDEAGTQTIRWNSNPYTNDLPFLYEWNMTDDSYTVQSGTTYPFKAMHSYMVQYHGDLYWSLASATPTPSPIVARRAYAEKPQNAEFRLELQQNEKMVDQTFVNMKDAEEISAGFKFDEDLCKEFNAGKANIYTLIENYLPAAGNTLPMSDQTTLVPVGVKTTAAGEYTFAMPESTNGVSVVLIDNIAGTRTNLALSDYTVSLGKGDLSDRFMLEIAPIKQMPTGIDAVSDQHSAVRKVMIDGILYIVKDGKVFDARGAKVK